MLDPKTLTQEERALLDMLVVYRMPKRDGHTIAWVYQSVLECEGGAAILARRALFGELASEGGKVCGVNHAHRLSSAFGDCMDCGQLAPAGGWPYFNEPAQPELADTDAEHEAAWREFRGKPDPVAAPTSEMPEAVRGVITYLRTHAEHLWKSGSGASAMRAESVIDALEREWRTHAAQPAKVGMTVELEMVMLAAELRLSRSYEGGWAWLESDQREVLRKAIAAVRAQAEQAQAVKLPKVRAALEMMLGGGGSHYSTCAAAALAELDAAEGVMG